MELTKLKDTMLFRGMSDEDMAQAAAGLHLREKRYGKGQLILQIGMKTSEMGLVLSGSVTIESSDMAGSRTILSHIGAGQFFAETYAYLGDEPLLIDVIANEDCTIALLRLDAVRSLPEAPLPWQTKLLSNLLHISARKNLILSSRSLHTSHKTIRERVMSYLNAVSVQTGSRAFDIPFDRQQLADYLNVERSALSKELGKMSRAGLIRVCKNHFTILGNGDEMHVY